MRYFICCFFPSLDEKNIEKIVENGELLQNAVNKYKHEENRLYLEINLKNFNFEDIKQEIKITSKELDSLWKEYVNNSWPRWIMNSIWGESSSPASLSIKALSKPYAIKEDYSRGKIITEFMLDKKNWVLGFCRFLWDKQLEKNILKIDYDLQPQETGEQKNQQLSQRSLVLSTSSEDTAGLSISNVGIGLRNTIQKTEGDQQQHIGLKKT